MLKFKQLQSAGKKIVLDTNQKKKQNWMGHIVREKGKLITVFDGTVEGDRKEETENY